MTNPTASCRCGQLRATVTGEPVRVSVCHCLNCKKRSGSAFAVQARWPAEQVTIEGRSSSFDIVADLQKRGWSEARLEKLMGGNFLRVYREAWGG